MATPVDPSVLQGELSTLKSKFQQALTIIKTVSAENESLRTQINTITTSIPSTKANEVIVADDEFARLEEENVRLKKEMEVLKADLDQIRNDFNTKNEENVSLIAQNTTLTQKTDSLSTKGQALLVRFQQQAQLLENSVKELGEMKEMKESLENDNKIISEDKNDLLSQLTDLREQINNGTNINDSEVVNGSRNEVSNHISDDGQEDKLFAKDQEILAKQEEILALKTTLNQSEDQNLSLQAIQDELHNQVAALEAQNNEKDGLIEDLQNQLSNHTITIASLQRHDVENQSIIAHNEQKIFELEGRLDSLNATNNTTETVATELQQMLSQNANLKKKNDLLTKMNETLNLDHDQEMVLIKQQHENELAEQTMQYENRFNELQVQYDGNEMRMVSERNQFQQVLQEKEQYITQLLSQIDSSSNTIKILESRIAEMDDNLHSIVVGHEQALQMMTLENGEKEQNFQNVIDSLQNELNTTQNQLEQLHNEYNTLNNNNNGNQSDLDGDVSSSSSSSTSPRRNNSSHTQQQSYNYLNEQFHNNNNNNNSSSTPSNRRSKGNQQYAQEITTAASHQRQLDSIQRQHGEELKKQEAQFQIDKTQIFSYITSLRDHITSQENYIAWLTSQLQVILLAQKRNGVDLDYVKNILLRFLLFQKLNLISQRDAMIPVIGQLLHFSPDEIKLLKTAEEKQKEFTNKNSSWGGWLGSNSNTTTTSSSSLDNSNYSFSQVFGHNLENDYDPMSSIQAQGGVSLSQQSNNKLKLEENNNDQNYDDDAKGENNDPNTDKNNTPTNTPQQHPSTHNYLKPGRNLGSNGILNSIKDLSPPSLLFEDGVNTIPFNLTRLGYKPTQTQVPITTRGQQTNQAQSQ